MTGLGSSGVVLGGVVWYAKNRFIKFDKKIGHMAQEVRDATAENNLQKEQITRLRDELKEVKQELRDLIRKL